MPAPPFPPDFWDSPPGGKIMKTERMPTDEGGELNSLYEKQPVEMPAVKPILQPSLTGIEDKPWHQIRNKNWEAGSSPARNIPRAGLAFPRQKKVARQEQEHRPARLLNKDNLLWGIVAREVLSPPRARRTFPFSNYGPGRS